MAAFELAVSYQDRSQRAKELKASGKKIFGYLCDFVPLEILTALDIVPYRIQGNIHEPIQKADACIESIACPFVRSCFDLALQGEFDFLDGLVIPHSCDTVDRIYDLWKYYRPPQYYHLINVPHVQTSGAYEFYSEELKTFITSLERFTGKQLTDSALRNAIKLHNENRYWLRQLYELRKAQPPLASGGEITRMLVAGMGLPVTEFTDRVRKLIAEIKARPALKIDDLPRILIYGCDIDDPAFIDLVEESGAYVVMDDLCTGSRFFWEDVTLAGDPLEAIARRYLDSVHCPRTYLSKKETREQDLENRFGYLYEFTSNFKVDGVILYVIRYCDSCEFDAPDIHEYLNSRNVPDLTIEDEYRLANIGQLRTRIQAFLEMIG